MAFDLTELRSSSKDAKVLVGDDVRDALRWAASPTHYCRYRYKPFKHHPIDILITKALEIRY